MDNAYHIFSSALNSMVNERQSAPRNVLKAWGDMHAAPSAAEAFVSLPDDDLKARAILKACGGNFQGDLGKWLEKVRKEKKAKGILNDAAPVKP